jgi:hypothetical protein
VLTQGHQLAAAPVDAVVRSTTATTIANQLVSAQLQPYGCNPSPDRHRPDIQPAVFPVTAVAAVPTRTYAGRALIAYKAHAAASGQPERAALRAVPSTRSEPNRRLQMAQDGQPLCGPAAAGDNQPGIRSPFRGQVPCERTRGIEDLRNPRDRCHPGQGSRRPAWVFGVEQDRRFQRPVVEVVLGIYAGSEDSTNDAPVGRDARDHVAPLRSQAMQPPGAQLAQSGRRSFRPLPERRSASEARFKPFTDPAAMSVEGHDRRGGGGRWNHCEPISVREPGGACRHRLFVTYGYGRSVRNRQDRHLVRA